MTELEIYLSGVCFKFPSLTVAPYTSNIHNDGGAWSCAVKSARYDTSARAW